MFELRIPSLRAALAMTALSAAALLAACGGGGGSAGSSPLATADVTYAQGAIAGFGSIIVGGVRYDDSGATVEDEDGNRSDDKSALKLGVMVQIDAGAVGTGAAIARRVRFGNEIVGPVGTITIDPTDSAVGTVVVLGQTVVVNASTVFDASLAGGLTALAAKPAGAVVEVHGILNQTTQQITATRVELEDSVTAYRLRGVVSALDTTAKTFKIGSETISYAGIAAASLPVNLADGQVVRVRLQTTKNVDGNWVATVLRSGKRGADGNREAHVEGVINELTSVTSFEINGLPVDAANAFFEDGTAGIVKGARVEVEGSIVNGVLVARKVEIEGSRDGGKRLMELHGVVGSLDATAQTFVLRGVTVSYATATFVRGTAANLSATPAPRIEVKGKLSADRTRLDATTVKFED